MRGGSFLCSLKNAEDPEPYVRTLSSDLAACFTPHVHMQADQSTRHSTARTNEGADDLLWRPGTWDENIQGNNDSLEKHHLVYLRMEGASAVEAKVRRAFIAGARPAGTECLQSLRWADIAPNLTAA